MSTSERALMEADLADSLEGEFAVPTVITDPAGVPSAVQAMVIYDSRRESTDSNGAPVIVKELAVTYRRSSLPASVLAQLVAATPLPFKIAVPQHAASATMTTYLIDLSKAPELSYTIGTVRFYPKRAVQG